MIVSEAGSSSNRLTTLLRLKRELGIASSEISNDKLLDDLIVEASDYIENLCERKFGRATVVEDLPAYGQYRLTLDRTPVASVTSVTFDGSTVSSTQYFVDNAAAGTLYNRRGFKSTRIWQHNIEDYPLNEGVHDYSISYTGGYILPESTAGDQTLPRDLERACLDVIKTRFFSAQMNPAYKSEKVGDAWYTNFDNAGKAGTIDGLPPTVTSVIKRYGRTDIA
jgi:hypothetical protein